MKKIAYIVAAAAATFAAPSYAATEGYVDSRVGIAFVDGTSGETLTLAVGYDVDIGTNVFLGAEASAITDTSFSDALIALNSRIGVNVSEKDKVFATVGTLTDTSFSGSSAMIGAGYEHQFGGSKVGIQFQRTLDANVSFVSVGFGFKF